MGIVLFVVNNWVHHFEHSNIVNIIFIIHVLINGFNQMENNLVQRVDMSMVLPKVFIQSISNSLIQSLSLGPQPADGKMIVRYLPTPLPGYEHQPMASRHGPTIEITYVIPSGTQGPLNPNPNHPFSGTTRKAYLPNTKEGDEILRLLQRAFDDQHVFTIGRSSTTGQDNVVTWNDIHHKTSPNGGPER